MIAYALIITKGCIHKPSMEVRLGTKRFGINCGALRQLIQRANEIGLYQVMENLGPEDNGIFELLYETFKDEIIAS